MLQPTSQTMPPLGWERDKLPSLFTSGPYNSGFPFMNPPIIQKLEKISKTLRARPLCSPPDPVINVDGTDTNLVKYLTNFLHSHISNHTRYNVRVFDHIRSQPEIAEVMDLEAYKRQIETWGKFWNFVFEAAVPPVANSGDASPVTGTAFIHHQTRASYVNIITFSPLMASLRAATLIPIDDAYGFQDHWEWLAGHWRGLVRPDITVLIQSYEETFMDQDVMRIQSKEMTVLLVTTAKNGDATITDKQLRRIAFEITEWVRND